MADLTPDEFEAGLEGEPSLDVSFSSAGRRKPSLKDAAFLKDLEGDTPQMEGTNVPDLRGGPQEFVSQGTLSEEAYMRRTEEPGVPLDVNTGADLMTRLKLSVIKSKNDQLDLLRRTKGGENVRLSPEGEFIYRVTDDEGKQRDILVDERGMGLKDFVDIAKEAPALAASIMTTKGIPVGSILKQAFFGALSYAGVAGLTEVGGRAAAGAPLEVGETIKRRGEDALTDLTVGYGLGKGAEAFGIVPRIIRSTSSEITVPTRKEAFAEIERARKRVSGRTGIPVEATIGELTGSPFAQRLESFLSNIPIARNIVLRSWQRQVENEKAVMRVFLGEADPSLEKTSQELFRAVSKGPVREVEQFDALRGKVRKGMQSQLEQPLRDIPGRALSDYEFGTRMIRRGDAQLNVFKKEAEAKFGTIKAQPDALAKVFDTGPLKANVQALKDAELVTKSGEKLEKAFELYGPSGKPVTTVKRVVPGTENTQEPIKQLVPTGVEPIMDAIDQLPDNMSYFDMVRLRNSIYDRLGSPEPISNRGTFLLKNLGSGVTAEMNKQAPNVLTSATQAMIKDANQFYSKNVETFYQKGILEMLKPRTEAGAVNPELVASRLLAGGKGSVTAFNTLKEFFKRPEAVAEMKSVLRDQVLDSAQDTHTGLIPLEDLTSRISKLEPEIVQELFGKAKDALLKSVQEGQLAMKATRAGQGFVPIERGAQTAVEYDSLMELFRTGKINDASVRGLVQRAERMRVTYQNEIKRATLPNKIGMIEAEPAFFAKEFLFNPNVPRRAVKQVMDDLAANGEETLLHDVRRTYIDALFRDTAKGAKGDPTQAISQLRSSPLQELDPHKFGLLFNDPTQRQRMKDILGETVFEEFNEFAVAISGRGQRDIAGLMTGALAGGSITSKVIKDGVAGMSTLPAYVTAAFLLTHPKMVRLLRTVGAGNATAARRVVRGAVLLPEFWGALSQYANTPEEAKQLAEEIQSWASREEPPSE
jgi:hypothetical protein